MAVGISPSPDTILAELLQAHPAVVTVLARRRMFCPGCPMATFETVAEVAAAYSIDTGALLREIAGATSGRARAGGASHAGATKSSRSRRVHRR